MSKSRTLILLIAASLSIAAYTWWGAYDTPFNPQVASNQENGDFIRNYVNLDVPVWGLGDSVTLCQSGTNSCALMVYTPANALWTKARNTDSRSKPDELWIIRLIRWILGDSSADYGFSSAGISGGGTSNTVSINGYWQFNQGYVNGVPVNGEWVFIVTSIVTNSNLNRPKL